MGETILETPRLKLVTWEATDGPLVQALHSSIETTRYLSGAAPWSRERAEQRLESWIAEHERDATGKYKLLRREDGAFIGRAGFSFFERSQEFELGYSLSQDNWGQGYATEIAAHLADWFFKRGIADRFIAFTHPENGASQRVLTKIGMTPCPSLVIDGITCATFEMQR